MREVDIHEARTTLSQLVETAEGGEDVLIARGGHIVARLTKAYAARGGIRLGTLKGMFKRIDSDFDALLPESALESIVKAPIEP